MPRPRAHLERAKAHLTEHGRTRAGVLSDALGITPAVLIAAMKSALESGEVVKTREGNGTYYELGDGTAPEVEEAADGEAAEIRWTIWDDGDLVIYGLQENTDGSHTVPAPVLEAIKKRIAWTPPAPA